MPIRHSPLLTPRSLAARRANALKSTGPRTPSGKARVSLNALKCGRSIGPAGRAPRFRERLLRAGYPCQEALYGGLRSHLAQAFGGRTPYGRREVDRFAAEAWCVAVGRSSFRTKLECALNSMRKGSRVLSQDPREGLSRSLRYPAGYARSLRYRAEDPWWRIGVVFWRQRRRYLTPARVKRMLRGLEPVTVRAADEGLENRVRCMVFRLRRPGYFERLRYGLDRNGDPDWNRQPWQSSLPGYREQWEAARRNSGCASPPTASSLRAGPSHARSHDAGPPASGLAAGLAASLDAAPVNRPADKISAADASEAQGLSADVNPQSRLTHRIRGAASRAVARVLTLASSCLR
jgi:hypothetical protein